MTSDEVVVGPTPYDDLLVGAVDLHAHVDVELSRTLFRKALPEQVWLRRAEEAGMRAVVLKSHMWPSAGSAALLAELYDGPVVVGSSVTLNPVVGGVDPWVVEVAAHLGARMVFLPTWGAANDRDQGGFHLRLDAAFTHFDPARHSVTRVVDDDGDLTPQMHEVLRLVHERGMVLSTGHVSWQESLAVAQEAHVIGFDRLLLAHPLSVSVDAPVDAVREIARLGASVEVCWPTVAPGRRHPAEVVALVRDVGADRTVLTSDYFGAGGPSPSDLLRLLMACLHDAGLSLDELRTAVSVNPARLLDLPAQDMAR